MERPDVFPFVFRAPAELAGSADVARWLTDHRDPIANRLRACGALVFRDFPLATAEDFDAVVRAFDFSAFAFEDSLSNAVRLGRTERVFTANEAPSTATIALHHELAQTRDFPNALFFFCEKPAERGGATVICRSDDLCDELLRRNPAFLARCEQHGLRYTTVMPPHDDAQSGQGRSWRSTFGVDDRDAAERALARLEYRWAWLPNERLRATTPALPAVRPTPAGRPAFFNQLIAAWTGWEGGRGADTAPVQFGNGEPLAPDGVAAAVEIAYELAVDLDWQRGDVALLDNRTVLHGRRPFEGTRQILAAFGR